jgi:hypothetical protein
MLVLDVHVAVLILAASVVLVLRPSLGLACLVLLASAAWWPANNHVIEGPTLVVLDHKHGLTLADLVGYVGVVAVLQATVRAPGLSAKVRAIMIVVTFVVVLAGLLAAFVTS